MSISSIVRRGVFAVFVVALMHVANASYSFLTLGDWGGAAIEEDTHNVYNVAAQMIKTATSLSPAFLINTGDNFYWCGIQNTTDFQVETDWVMPYSDSSLNFPWYSILGNHEYGYNVDAQIELSQLYAKWVMDSRYYTRRVQMDDTNYMTMVFLDTSPCVSDYRSSNQKYWDPCSTSYPTCSLDSTDDDFEGECMFNSNILSQSCEDQYAWLSLALDNIPKDDWVVISGHHPIDEVDVMDFTSLVQEHGFSIYFNGHSHVLNRYTIDNTGIYITSGAGSLVDTPDQSHPLTAAKVRGENIPADDVKRSSKSSNKGVGHSYQTVFTEKVAGFTQHIFNDDFTIMTTNIISYTGDIIHTFNSNKAGSVL